MVTLFVNAVKYKNSRYKKISQQISSTISNSVYVTDEQLQKKKKTRVQRISGPFLFPVLLHNDRLTRISSVQTFKKSQQQLVYKAHQRIGMHERKLEDGANN